MMREDIRDALENAREPMAANLPTFRDARPVRRWSFGRVRKTVLAVIQELPEDMSLTELREELEGSNHDL